MDSVSDTVACGRCRAVVLGEGEERRRGRGRVKACMAVLVVKQW